MEQLMKQKFSLIPEVEKFLQSGSKIVTNNYEIYYMPFYLSKLEDGIYNILQFDELPEEVVKFIKNEREI